MSIALRHSRAAEQAMLDWLRDADEGLIDPPTYRAIMHRYAFDDISIAKGLIAQLSDGGFIATKPNGPDGFTWRFLPPRKPRAPSVTVNRDVSLDEDDEMQHRVGVARLKEIGLKLAEARAKQPARPTGSVTVSVPPAVRVATPVRAAVVTAPPPTPSSPVLDHWPKCGHPRTPQNSRAAGRNGKASQCKQCWYDANSKAKAEKSRKASEAREAAKPAPPPPAPKAHPLELSVGFTLHPNTMVWLERSLPSEPGAETRDELARAIFMEGMYRRLAIEPARPLIRGVILRMWQKAGRPDTIDSFITMLLDRGVAEYLREGGAA
jgi:hypothetical protein